jgi:uncharacterized protein (TIGR00251 family)
MNAITPTKDGLLLNIEVSAKSDKFKISGYNEWRNSVEVKIKAVPQKGKANKEIVNEFSRITKNPVEIVSGHKSHHKILKIYDMEENELRAILKSFINFN